jgi:hypothetical protein
MVRVPDWAGTNPESVDEFMSRLSAKTRKILLSAKIGSIGEATKLKIDLAKSLWYRDKRPAKGLGRASLKEIEMALGIYYPASSSLDTSRCWICNGKIGNYPSYCSKHCAELNAMKGSWQNFISPLGVKGKAEEERHSNIAEKAVRRWLKQHSPTIICEEDAKKWAGKFNALIQIKLWKRRFYREGSFQFHQWRYFFHEGSDYSVGQMWVNGELVRILPIAALPAMNQMRRVAERSGRAA